MSTRILLLTAVMIGFAILTAVALRDVGYLGILKPLVHTWGGAQVFADLIILAVLACTWMRRDARARGISVTPFIVITVLAGSFGPLCYLLMRERRRMATS